MSSIPVPRSPEQFFAGSPIGLPLYRRVAEVVRGTDPAEVRVTNIELNSVADVDDAVAGWLREAFENASPAVRRGDSEGTDA